MAHLSRYIMTRPYRLNPTPYTIHPAPPPQINVLIL